MHSLLLCCFCCLLPLVIFFRFPFGSNPLNRVTTVRLTGAPFRTGARSGNGGYGKGACHGERTQRHFAFGLIGRTTHPRPTQSRLARRSAALQSAAHQCTPSPCARRRVRAKPESSLFCITLAAEATCAINSGRAVCATCL